jgi:hypothetical protein
MNSDELTKPQLKKLAEQLRRKRDYVDSLIARMDALRFDTNDRYYRLVKKSRDAVHELWVNTYFMANGKHRMR